MREIVVGVEDSEGSRAALDQALLQAELTGRPVLAVNAWSYPVWGGGVPGVGYDVLQPPLDSAHVAQQLVDGLVEEALGRRAPDPGLVVRTQVQQGDPGRVLVELAEQAGLLVVGGRAHGPVLSALLGSATTYCLHHAGCPVMVVPHEAPSLADPARVVVGLDDSAGSRSALRWGLDAARRHGCPLVVVHAWVLSAPPGRDWAQHLPSPEQSEAWTREWFDRELAEVLPDRRGIEVRAELVRGGPSQVLLDVAGADDLLVLGARGRGGFASLVLGSVATQCAQHAHGLAVVVREHEERLEP